MFSAPRKHLFLGCRIVLLWKSNLVLLLMFVPLKLTAEKKVDRRLLPPKKILGKNSKSLVERRQKELELYLQTLLQQFPQATPTPLTNFLHFHLYVSTTYKQVCSSWFRITSVWSGGLLGLHYSKENEVRESCWLIRSRCSHSF